MEINFKGLTLQIDKIKHTRARPAPMAQTPDCPGYSDPGDDEEIEFDIIGVEIDCPETLIEALYASFEEDIGTLVIEEME